MIVIDNTHQCILRAADLVEKKIPLIPISFNLRGRAAGMYRVKNNQSEIRYNSELFAKYFTDNIENTIPHEVAHYVIHCCYGLRTVRPHGKEWQQLMIALGAEPSVTCSYDMHDIPQRRMQHFTYRCGCRSHQLSTIRHNKIQRGMGSYTCKLCKQPLHLET